jgi:hypothetical protein
MYILRVINIFPILFLGTLAYGLTAISLKYFH